MGGGSEKTIKAEITMSTETKDVMVKEVDASGNEITNSTVYTTVISPRRLRSQRRTAAADRDHRQDPAGLCRDRDGNRGRRSKCGESQTAAHQKVAYKDTAIRVNSVYYIGIFDDPELTKLRYSRAMVLNDASELTASLLVNLDKTETGEVTFYFAEVDEEGNLLESGKDFGMTLS